MQAATRASHPPCASSVQSQCLPSRVPPCLLLSLSAKRGPPTRLGRPPPLHRVSPMQLTLVAIWFMTWPKSTSFLTALLWFMVALLMLLGVGEWALAHAAVPSVRTAGLCLAAVAALAAAVHDLQRVNRHGAGHARAELSLAGAALGPLSRHARLPCCACVPATPPASPLPPPLLPRAAARRVCCV